MNWCAQFADAFPGDWPSLFYVLGLDEGARQGFESLWVDSGETASALLVSIEPELSRSPFVFSDLFMETIQVLAAIGRSGTPISQDLSCLVVGWADIRRRRQLGLGDCDTLSLDPTGVVERLNYLVGSEEFNFLKGQAIQAFIRICRQMKKGAPFGSWRSQSAFCRILFRSLRDHPCCPPVLGETLYERLQEGVEPYALELLRKVGPSSGFLEERLGEGCSSSPRGGSV